MAKNLEIYRCSICGNTIEIFSAGGGTLVCCGKEMILMSEKNREGAGEKHLPVLEKKDNGVLVRVGSVPHPMEEKHWIQMIEIITNDGYVLRKDLKPSDKPEAFFIIDYDKISTVREFCNIHRLWAINK